MMAVLSARSAYMCIINGLELTRTIITIMMIIIIRIIFTTTTLLINQ